MFFWHFVSWCMFILNFNVSTHHCDLYNIVGWLSLSTQMFALVPVYPIIYYGSTGFISLFSNPKQSSWSLFSAPQDFYTLSVHLYELNLENKLFCLWHPMIGTIYNITWSCRPWCHWTLSDFWSMSCERKNQFVNVYNCVLITFLLKM